MTSDRSPRPPGKRGTTRLTRRLFRLALLAFPREFRARQGTALLHTLEADLGGTRGVQRLGRLSANLWDVIRAGLSERRSRRQAQRKVPGVHGHRDYGVPLSLSRWAVDLRHACRALLVRRGSSAATVTVFSLGIGLATAMFVLADPYVFRPLPYARPDELVVIRVGSGARGGGPPASMPTLDQWRSRADLFKGVAAYTPGPDVWVESDAGRASLDVLDVTDNLFEVLETRGELPLAPADAGARETQLVLTSQGRQKLAPGHEDVIQGPSGHVFRVAGALSRPLLLPGPWAQADAVSTFRTGPLRTIEVRANGGYSSSRLLTVLARVRPGLSPATVGANLRGMMPPEADYPVYAEGLSDVMTRDVKPLALGALAAAALVLLVCAGNVASLLAARDAWRAHEFATREALGASRLDVLRLRLFEVAGLSGVSLIAGIGLAWVALAACARVIPVEYVTLGEPQITWRAVLSAVLGSAAVMALAVVALLVTRTTRRRQMPVAGRGRSRLRVGLLVMQAAFAVVLAVGAAMLVQSYWNLRRFDLGVDRQTLTVSVSPATLPGESRRTARRLDVANGIEALKRIPGISSVSARQNSSRGRGFVINGTTTFAFFEETLPGFFATTGMRVVRGRPLAAGDDEWRALAVNEAFVRAHWPGRSGLGELVLRDGRQASVVGVVADVQEFPFVEPASPMIYSLVTELPAGASYVLSATGDPRAYGAAVRRALGVAHPDAEIGSVDTVGARLMDRVRNRTFAMVVLTFFAVTAVTVTIAGLAGLVGFLIARRTREIAIRMAIGARWADIRRLVARDAVQAACVGALAGLVLGRWLSTWLESLVFGIEAGNWTTALLAAVAVVSVMTAGAVLPARRALRLQPTEALRVE